MACVRYYLEPVGVTGAPGAFTDGTFTFAIQRPVGTPIARECRGGPLPGLGTGAQCEITFAPSDAPVDLVFRNGTAWTLRAYGSNASPVVLQGASSTTPRVLQVATPGLWRIVIESGNETDILEICRCG